MQTTQVDIIIAGGGLAGLTLALECSKHTFFDDKKIVILDRDDKSTNDRTWCFWAANAVFLPPVLFRSWKNCRFFGEDFDRALNIEPFTYHMIRGLDFYQWAKSVLNNKPNIVWIKANIESIDSLNGVVKTNAGVFKGAWVFNSAFRAKIEEPQPNDQYTQLLQHFQGWVIQTTEAQFDPSTITLMDYRVAQKGDTRFVYVLPFSETEAMVEFTVFSTALCSKEEYTVELNNYINKYLQITDFKIKETEFGVIPMVDIPLKNQEGRVVNIGTAGGFVKGSSGYAFMRTQRKIKGFVENWVLSGAPDPAILRSSWRYRFYDSVMLRVLKNKTVAGSRFFSMLFQHLPAALIFRFLVEVSTFADDIRLMRVPPIWPFLKTAMKQIPILPKI